MGIISDANDGVEGDASGECVLEKFSIECASSSFWFGEMDGVMRDVEGRDG